MSTVRTLPDRAVAVLMALATGRVAADASNAELAVVTGCHQRTVSRMLAELQRRGLIRIERIAPNPHGPGSDPTGRRLHVVHAPTAPTTYTAHVAAVAAVAVPAGPLGRQRDPFADVA
jgi:predicted transcriptional regulator